MFEKLLRTIPVDSTENLELDERNPDYQEDQSNSKKFNNSSYTENNQLKYGQNKYQITIIYQGKPIVLWQVLQIHYYLILMVLE